eukprot:Phypoly_transcript_04265.p1 GENE.Phypoly_transcript_04265~~Phypoly_transcript_04265.p1  ORF type:complete len:454 (+),score=51.76 Phypoly_transcript_04265:712-2073(+)
MIPLTNSHTEIEESLLPDIADAERDAAKRRRVYICIIVSFILVVASGILTGVLYVVLRKDPIPASIIPTVILISLDGFRWDYLDMYKEQTPFMNQLRGEGTYSAFQPCFVTKTFPNHYSIVTGLYPESHGIIANTFYDPTFNATFRIDTSAVTEARWWGGEPLWVSVQNNGLRSGIYFWPGSEAPIMGVLPTYFKQYNYNTPMNDRVQGVIQWLDMPDAERPNFIALYMEVVDSAGHAYGPNSTEVGAAAKTVDDAIGQLFAHLGATGKFNSTNIVIVSDHGMASLSSERVVFIDDCVNLSKIAIIDMSPNCYIIPNNASETQEIMQDLEKCKSMQYPNITSYLREDVPERLFYNTSLRITPILVVADLGWSITLRRGYNPSDFDNRGNHGYDNKNSDMYGIFLAHGPNIKSGVPLGLVSNLDVYNFVTHLLQTPAAPNNGSTVLIDQLAIKS